MTGKQKILDAQLANTDECILWPHSLSNKGYPQVYWDGKTVSAHRLSCELAHGEPPTPAHETAHSCHNKACINPRHLRWATPAENRQDNVDRGAYARGEQSTCVKLTEPEVLEIRRLWAQGETKTALAKQFGVGRRTVYDILAGKTWNHLNTQ